MELTDVWPVFGLRLISPRLELRPARDDDLAGIVEAVLGGIHEPDKMPFGIPWTEAPREQLIRETAKHQWAIRSRVSPDDWTMNFVVLEGGTPIGVQDLSAQALAVRKTVSTGSWLSMARQGHGLGKEMRAAVLSFAFDYLGAAVAESSAATWNHQSLGVSRALGYKDNGVSSIIVRDGVARDEQQLRLESRDFVRPDWSLTVVGFDEARRDLVIAE